MRLGFGLAQCKQRLLAGALGIKVILPFLLGPHRATVGQVLISVDADGPAPCILELQLGDTKAQRVVLREPANLHVGVEQEKRIRAEPLQTKLDTSDNILFCKGRRCRV